MDAFGPSAQICGPAPDEPSDTGHSVPEYAPPDRGFTPAPERPSHTGHPAPEQRGPVIDAAEDEDEGLTGAALGAAGRQCPRRRVIDRNREVWEGDKVIGEIDVEGE